MNNGTPLKISCNMKFVCSERDKIDLSKTFVSSSIHIKQTQTIDIIVYDSIISTHNLPFDLPAFQYCSHFYSFCFECHEQTKAQSAKFQNILDNKKNVIQARKGRDTTFCTNIQQIQLHPPLRSFAYFTYIYFHLFIYVTFQINYLFSLHKANERKFAQYSYKCCCCCCL